MERTAYFSTKGPIREKNEDYVYAARNDFGQQLLIACDGVGGTAGGEIASEISCRTMLERFSRLNFSTIEEREVVQWFESTLELIRHRISEQIKVMPQYQEMATTLTMALVTEKKVFVFNIGDSRTYFIRNKDVIQITEDHTVENYLKRNNSPDEMWKRFEKDLASLTSTVNSSERKPPRYDYYIHASDEYDAIVCCTDGLYNFIKVSEFASGIKAKDLETYCSGLATLAIVHKSNDNISLAVLAK